jgi:hypothetical protein
MSNLNYGAIDETYPVAGQDNNSQGFRGNFAAIKASLQTAQSDITTLETTTAKTNASNDFLTNGINNATYNKFYGAVYNLSNILTPQDISLNNGPLQYVTFAGNTTVTFKNWPATGKYAVIRVHLISDGNAARNATLATANGGTITYETATAALLTGGAFVLAQNQKHRVLEVWTYNGGAKIFVRSIGEF